MRNRRAFTWFAWAVLAYNIPVILWGAYVRVSFSGDGCGAHWPFCNGQVIPQRMAAPTFIEYTHRLMTSLDTIGVVALCLWALLVFPRRHAVRLASACSLLFLIVEALLGAGLVLFRLVANDQSAGRVLYLGAHLTNTLLLLAALTGTAWLAQKNVEAMSLSRIRSRAWTVLLIVLFVSITGAVAALGDTLFPAASVSAGLHQDFSAGSHFLVRLRFVHPVIALLGAALVLWLVAKTLPNKSAARVITIVIFQLAAGVVNVALLAPVWMQLTHLLMADLVWIAAVLWSLEHAQIFIKPSHVASVSTAV